MRFLGLIRFNDLPCFLCVILFAFLHFKFVHEIPQIVYIARQSWHLKRGWALLMHVSSFDFLHSKTLQYNVWMEKEEYESHCTAKPKATRGKGAKENCADKESKIEFAIRIRRAANRAISVCLMWICTYERRRWLAFMNVRVCTGALTSH